MLDLRAKSDVVHGFTLGSSVIALMIETPHPVHTHSRSSLYIFIKCFITFNSVYSVMARTMFYVLCSRCELGTNQHTTVMTV